MAKKRTEYVYLVSWCWQTSEEGFYLPARFEDTVVTSPVKIDSHLALMNLRELLVPHCPSPSAKINFVNITLLS